VKITLMRKPLGALCASACTCDCITSECQWIKGEVNDIYHLTLWPGLVVLKHCQWMDGTRWQKCQASKC